MAEQSISDIIEVTLRSRYGELADNVCQNNALLRRLAQRPRVPPTKLQKIKFWLNMWKWRFIEAWRALSGYEREEW
jgi:hypothetical protein